MIKIKTLFTALFLAPVVLFAETSANELGKPITAQASIDAITDQEIKLLQQNIQDKRRQIVAANIPLTTEESAKFWPVYDQYIGEVSKVLDSRYAQIREYAAHYNTMDDKQASDYVSKLLDADKAIADLRVKYRANFEKVISKQKAAMFTQLDRRVQMLIDIQRAGAIPLINPK